MKYIIMKKNAPMQKNNHILISIIILAAVLRLYQLGSMPKGLNISEVEIGYNAYLLAQTGKDKNNEGMPILFNNKHAYATPVYTYLTIPFISMFGLNGFSVRLVSALAGVVATLIVYYTTKQIVIRDENKTKIALIASALYAINPWSLNISRAAVEINLALAFVLCAIVSLLIYCQYAAKKMLLLTITTTICAIYTYAPTALFIIPYILIALTIYSKKIKLKKTIIIITTILITCAPLIYLNIMRPGKYQLITPFVLSNPKYYLGPYSGVIQKYLAYFSPDFLFFAGDQKSLLYSVQGFGLMYMIEALTVLGGCIYTVKKKQGTYKILYLWLFLAPTTGALSKTSPDALKAAWMIPPLTMLSALGINYSMQQILMWVKIKWLKISIYSAYSALALYAFTSYLDLYYVHHIPKTAWEWRENITKTAEYIAKMDKTPNQRIIIEAEKEDLLYMHFFEAQVNKTNQKNKKNNYINTQDITKTEIKNNDIVAIHGWKGTPQQMTNTKEIKIANGQIAYKVGIWQK